MEARGLWKPEVPGSTPGCLTFECGMRSVEFGIKASSNLFPFPHFEFPIAIRLSSVVDA